MKTLLPTSLAAFILASAACAQDLPSFEEVDKNNDGAIDRIEAVIVEGLDFATADANQDGAIDRQEYNQLS